MNDDDGSREEAEPDPLTANAQKLLQIVLRPLDAWPAASADCDY